jgi:hypothetical protein
MMSFSFGMPDQADFARLSGDYNPLHLDPLAARRTMFGRVVVHGIHAVLRALDAWIDDGRVHLTFLRASFPRAIGLDEEVSIVVDANDPADAELRLTVHGSDVVVMKTGWAPGPCRGDAALPPGHPAPAPCREMERNDIPSATGALPLAVDRAEAERLFPRLVAAVPLHQVAAILATTRLVGMECPGLHSVFGGLTLTFGETVDGAPVMEYRVASYQAPLSRLVLELRAPGCAGTITAFIRPGPAVQPGVEALRPLVTAGEFAGQRALVVGGSRGLGEVAAKVLAAGGASVRVTYHRGARDAARVVEEIRRAGAAADCIALDVLSRETATAVHAADPWIPTHLYYFATPPILPGTPGSFSDAVLSTFRAYYVDGFRETVERVRRVAPALRAVFYPSSIAVDETPAGLAEYAAAKSAGEDAARALSQAVPGLVITTPRLPRLTTDQTATFLPVHAENPAPVLAHHLRELSRRAASAPPAPRR